jgi:DnaJ-class molecular chaperone
MTEIQQTILIHERGNKCAECNGTGVSGGFDCESCDGEGYTDDPPTVSDTSQHQNMGE